ncbi:hypothetical protein FPQ18DRAFT_262951, partial [Pyronema domesticum]
LESVEAALKQDPTNAELSSLVSELHEIIELTSTVLAETNAAAAAAAAAASQSRPAGPSNSYSSAAHAGNDEVQEDHVYAVGDTCLARWTSGDNAFYPAKITSVTGSSKNPVYLVKFTQYNVTEQLGPRDLKVQGRKRRGGSPAPQAGFTPTGAAGAVGPTLQAPVVISKPAAVDEAAMRERREGAEGVKKKKKIDKGKGALEAEKKKWQTFAAKGVKGARVGKMKKIGEGSMFRTPESVNGRVGFTGSGQPMRKDVTRGKHIYSHADEEE